MKIFCSVISLIALSALALLNTNLPASDPDSGPALFSSLRRPVDDLKIYEAVSQIYTEQLDQAEQSWLDSGWSKVDLANVPTSAKIELPKADGKQLSLDRVCRATGVVALGGSPQNLAMAGAVVISPEGLAITNYHVASLINDRIVIVLSDGTVARVIKIIAANATTDVAIITMGDGPSIASHPIAMTAPERGSAAEQATDQADTGDTDAQDAGNAAAAAPGAQVVKLAVPHSAIRSLIQ